jgi:hypothetical protein
MKNNNLNTSLLVMHEYHLENYNLYKLYKLRKSYLNNNNYIVIKLNEKILNMIENVILKKKNGNELLNIIKQSDILYEEIKSENINIFENVKLLKIYKNMNIMENLMGLKKDVLFKKSQLKIRIKLQYKEMLINIKEKILLCKW